MAKAAVTAEPEGLGLEAYKQWFSESVTVTEKARKESEIAEDYFHGVQLTRDELLALEQRKQPALVLNHVRLVVNGTLGVIRQGNTDPRAYPRNPQDADAADVASKTLRFIADQNRFDEIKEAAARDYLVAGTCAAIIEYVDGEIRVEQIRQEEFFYDPRSRKADFSDARYMGVAKWDYADDVSRDWPDHAAEIASAVTAAAPVPDTMQDRPTDAISWVNAKDRRVMIVEMYHRDGAEWRRCVFYAGGILEQSVSPYLDDRGRSSNPIEARSCYVDRENNRYGVVRDMRSPQDEINKRRSKSLHLLSVRQVEESVDGALAGHDVENIRREAARPDGVIPSGLRVVSNSEMAAGHMSLLSEAKGEIERMGPNPAMLGRQGASASGRAQMIRQQAGLTELATIYGGIEDWETRVYRQMWNRARQFKKEPWFIRVTDDNRVSKFIGLNQPKMQPAVNPLTGEPAMGPDGQPVMQPVIGPNGQPVLENEIAKLDVDIILDSVPDTANLQQEQWEALVELVRSGVDLASPVGQLLFEASSLPNKSDIIEKLKGQAETPEAQQAREQQTLLAARGAAAKIAETEASAALKGAQAQGEQMDTALKAEQAFGPPSGIQPGF